jgi:penicillin G amidase
MTRDALCQTAVNRGLSRRAVSHGKMRGIQVANLFFGGKLSRFLCFDRPLSHIGSRATVAQAESFRMGPRLVSFGATFRMICDLGEDSLHVNISGGASDRRFSKYYASGSKAWEECEYEVMRADGCG